MRRRSMRAHQHQEHCFVICTVPTHHTLHFEHPARVGCIPWGVYKCKFAHTIIRAPEYGCNFTGCICVVCGCRACSFEALTGVLAKLLTVGEDFTLLKLANEILEFLFVVVVLLALRQSLFKNFRMCSEHGAMIQEKARFGLSAPGKWAGMYALDTCSLYEMRPSSYPDIVPFHTSASRREDCLVACGCLLPQPSWKPVCDFRQVSRLHLPFAEVGVDALN